MTVSIALLRAINVGGHNKVPMQELRTLVADLGGRFAKTLLQSGNRVFAAEEDEPAAWEARLQSGLVDRLGVDVDVLIRSPAEWRTVMEANPLSDRAADDPKRMLTMLLRDAPAESAIDALVAWHQGPEKIAVIDRTAYLYYPEGAGRSKLTNVAIERHLGTRGTARNWNTVEKLAVLAAERETERQADASRARDA